MRDQTWKRLDRAVNWLIAFVVLHAIVQFTRVAIMLWRMP